jgi:hypothetical protein
MMAAMGFAGKIRSKTGIFDPSLCLMALDWHAFKPNLLLSIVFYLLLDSLNSLNLVG